MRGATVVNMRYESYDVMGDRSSFAGNPFVLGRDGDRAEVLRKYEAWLDRHPELVERARREFAGKRVGCWCKPKDCHLDILVARMEALEDDGL